MQTIIIATGKNPSFKSMNERLPVEMVQLIDRPFLQHLTEDLINQGYQDLAFLSSHLPEKIEEHFGDGTRWGGHFTYRLSRNEERPYNSLPKKEPLLIIHADCIPLFPQDTE